MNRTELIKQIYQESNCGATKQQIGKIINTMARVMLEELLIDPERAYIRLAGIGIFKLMKKKVYVNPKKLGKGERIYMDRWCFKFIPTKVIKDIANGKKDIHEWIIGHDPAYPDRKKVNYATPAYARSFIKRQNGFKRGVTVVDKARKQKEDIAKRLPEID